ncbi:MAG: hypothetical protein ACFFCS_01300 [Candidatus Hodarchaeota archaeon]
MPKGMYCIIWDPVTGPNVHAKYSVQGDDLPDDTVNKIFISHAAGSKPVEKMALQIDDVSIASKFMERKEEDRMARVLLVLTLNTGEKAENFFEQLDALEGMVWDNYDKSQLKMNVLIKDAFKKMAVEVTSKLDAETIRKRVIKRAQELLDENKINEAQSLLSRSKGMPDALVRAAKDGFQLRGEKKYEKSVRAYEEAKRIAISLQEPELADTFDNDAKRSADIPVFEKARERAIEAGRDLLRREEFIQSAEKFKEASELSDKLDDIIGKEINFKKYEILSQYGELDELSKK